MTVNGRHHTPIVIPSEARNLLSLGAPKLQTPCAKGWARNDNQRKTPYPNCHSERSEESAVARSPETADALRQRMARKDSQRKTPYPIVIPSEARNLLSLGAPKLQTPCAKGWRAERRSTEDTIPNCHSERSEESAVAWNPETADSLHQRMARGMTVNGRHHTPIVIPSEARNLLSLGAPKLQTPCAKGWRGKTVDGRHHTPIVIPSEARNLLSLGAMKIVEYTNGLAMKVGAEQRNIILGQATNEFAAEVVRAGGHGVAVALLVGRPALVDVFL